MVTQQDILEQLDALKKKDRSYFSPREAKAFLPNAIPNVNKGPNRDIFTAQMQSVLDRSNAATLTEQIKHQNRVDYQQMREAQQSLARAQRSLTAAGNMKRPSVTGRGGSLSFTDVSRGAKPGNYGKAKGIGVGQNLGHYNWKGRGLTLNRSVAPRFIGFLNALAKTGYKVHSLGSYSNRNIAGTSTKSLHSYGLAIDINPGSNPVTYGRPVTNLPKGVGRLAAKYGLVWGGNWNGSKKDTMHFSVPYGGRK